MELDNAIRKLGICRGRKNVKAINNREKCVGVKTGMNVGYPDRKKHCRQQEMQQGLSQMKLGDNCRDKNQ